MLGTITSPESYDNYDVNGLHECHFEINFTTPAPFTLLSVTAWNASTSRETQIELFRDNGPGTLPTPLTFPLPKSGQKETTGPYAGYFKATISQATINAQGFVVLGDLSGYTVF